jgi:hypothetical protein
LRFVFKTESGRANLGTSFYAAKSIADGSFYLINVIDSAYNSGALTESNSAFDTLLDDMLCARIVTNGSNIATITSLANADRLINRTMISGSALNQIPWGVWSGGSFILNWSRIPALSVPTFEAVKHQNSEITDGTEWGLIGQGALAVFGIRVTSGSLTRYGGTLDYVYDDVDTHNQGWFHVNCVSEA